MTPARPEKEEGTMPDRPDFPLRIFYDGSCVVCAGEVEHYLRQDKGAHLIAVDIAAPGFDPAVAGFPLTELMYQLHAIDNSGRVYRGVESFWAIWQAFPASTLYGFLGFTIMLPFINPLARLCYRIFARLRPYLPKRHNCDSGSCSLHRR